MTAWLNRSEVAVRTRPLACERSASRFSIGVRSTNHYQPAAPISHEDLDKVISRVGAKWVGFGIDGIVIAPDATSLPADIVDLMAREKVSLESSERIEPPHR